MEKSGNGKLFPFEMGYLTPFFQKKAETELNETPENREKSLRPMREMIKKDELFNGLNIDDDLLIQYLRCKKYNIDRAFSQLKSLVKFRKKTPEVFTNIEFKNVSALSRDGIVNFLPYRCSDGCAIIFVEFGIWKSENIPFEELKRCVMLLFMQSLRDPMTQVNGFKLIFDNKSIPLWHLPYYTPTNLYMLYHATQDCVPGRFKGIHFVNQSRIAKFAWLILKNVMSDKLRKRVIFHSGPEKLLDYFPRDVLPVKCGGDLEHYDMTDWMRKVTQPEMLASWIFGESPK